MRRSVAGSGSSSSNMRSRASMSPARGNGRHSVSPADASTRSPRTQNVRLSLENSRVSRASSSSSTRPQEALADAIAMKQKREAAALEAKERREAKEMEGCTFSPRLDSRSVKLVEMGAGSDRAALHTPKSRPRKPEGESISPARSPRLNNVSRAIVEGLDRRGPIEKRLMETGNTYHEKHAREKEAAERRAEAEAKVLHSPKINKKSREIAHSQSTTVHERLTHTYLSRKQESVEKLKQEADERLAASVAKLHYMSEASKRILRNPSSRTSSAMGDHSISSTTSTPRRIMAWATSPRMSVAGTGSVTPLGGEGADLDLKFGSLSNGKAGGTIGGGTYTLSSGVPRVTIDSISPVPSPAPSSRSPAPTGSRSPTYAGRSFESGNGSKYMRDRSCSKDGADEAALQRSDEVQRLSARCDSLGDELESVRAERNAANRAVEVMRKDLDSITEKGQAVVRLNQQLMNQIAALKEQLARQQHECRLHHVHASGAHETPNHVNGINSSKNGTLHYPQDRGANGMNGSMQTPDGRDSNKLGALAAKAAQSLSPRAGRRRIRPASDSDDSFSSLDDDE